MPLQSDGVYPAEFARHWAHLFFGVSHDGNQATGRWMKASPFENPWILADQLANSLQNWKAPSSEQSYVQAPDIRPPSSGEELFRTRCAACHSVGPEDGQGVGMRNVGPDLLGVTQRRDRAWLSRWIREPDRMLAERDALALTLFEQFNRVAMPNLRLSSDNTDSVLEFLEQEARRQGVFEQAQALDDEAAIAQ